MVVEALPFFGYILGKFVREGRLLPAFVETLINERFPALSPAIVLYLLDYQLHAFCHGSSDIMQLYCERNPLLHVITNLCDEYEDEVPLSC